MDSKNIINEEIATWFGVALQESHSIISLSVSGNQMDDNTSRMLIDGLIHNNTLTHLDVSCNKISCNGLRVVLKGLLDKPNSILSVLNVADNHIQAEGGRSLGRILRTNTSLVDLNIRLNSLGDEGGKMVFEGLHKNSTLTRLNIASNRLASDAANALAIALTQDCCELCVLDLSSNQLCNDDIENLGIALQNNYTVISLDHRLNNNMDTIYLNENETTLKIDNIINRNHILKRKEDW